MSREKFRKSEKSYGARERARARRHRAGRGPRSRALTAGRSTSRGIWARPDSGIDMDHCSPAGSRAVRPSAVWRGTGPERTSGLPKGERISEPHEAVVRIRDWSERDASKQPCASMLRSTEAV